MIYQYHFYNFIHYERFHKHFFTLRSKLLKRKQFPRTQLCVFHDDEKLLLVIKT